MSSPKRADACVPVKIIELSPRRRGARLSEIPSRLSDELGRGYVLVGCLLPCFVMFCM
ncbi:hypothetical protein DEO72_LG10g633 [Vigna unguiculata]|uniref:Uncharacterized protein n=1 Tax=Vigna unguiculata TaxID=3917 RepID=A0A4D6N9F0_VIGUN|nr:hypothetical protein DEO72_LG10g633 [Vigna unguiculata]